MLYIQGSIKMAKFCVKLVSVHSLHSSHRMCISQRLRHHQLCLFSALQIIAPMQRRFFCKNYQLSSNIIINTDNVFSDANKIRIKEHIPKMRKYFKKEPLQKVKADEPARRQSAILVPMCTINGEPSLLFIVRSMYIRSHRGEVSFPGGMSDAGDRDLVHTALRETFEEIGLKAETVDVWGQLPDVPSRRGSQSDVTPVIGYCGPIDMSSLMINPEEVAEVFSVSIATLCSSHHQRQTQWRLAGSEGFTLPVFLGGPHRIWGLTAIITHQVLNLLAPGLYSQRLKHRR